MKRIKRLFCIGLVFIIVMETNAQETAKIRTGFGVTFGKELFLFDEGDASGLTLPFDFANVSVVIRGTKFRLEPRLGYFRFSRSSSTSFGSGKFTFSNWRLGALVAANKIKGSTNYYYGANLGLIFTSQSSNFGSDSDSESKTDFFIGPAIGGEHMFSENFSLGGEIQVNYISMGEFNGESSIDVSQTAISTRGMIVVRWYL